MKKRHRSFFSEFWLKFSSFWIIFCTFHWCTGKYIFMLYPQLSLLWKSSLTIQLIHRQIHIHVESSSLLCKTSLTIPLIHRQINIHVKFSIESSLYNFSHQSTHPLAITYFCWILIWVFFKTSLTLPLIHWQIHFHVESSSLLSKPSLIIPLIHWQIHIHVESSI